MSKISQKTLEQYFGLNEDLRRIRWERDLVRRHLLDLDVEGAAVEPGVYSLDIQMVLTRSITRVNLENVIGHAETQRIADMIPPVFHQRLTVKFSAVGYQVSSVRPRCRNQ